jgi:uncharacterized membrane protein
MQCTFDLTFFPIRFPRVESGVRSMPRSNMTTTQWLCCALIAAYSTAGTARQAIAQRLPCYEVAAVIQAPPVASSLTIGQSISPNGRYVVGSYLVHSLAADKAFYYDTQSGQFVPLPVLPGTFTSMAMDVNDAGQVVGRVTIPAGNKGFIYSIATGQYTLLEPINPQGVCDLTGITSDGVVSGTRSIGSKSDPVFPKTAFIWSPESGFVDLGVVDGWSTFGVDIAEDRSVAVGVGFGLAAHWWDGKQSSTVGMLPGADGLTPWGISSGHRVVGSALFIQGATSWSLPFDFHDGVLTALPVLDAVNRSCVAHSVSGQGLVVGACKPLEGPGIWLPCAWHARGVTHLRNVIGSAPGIVLGSAVSISETEHIVCAARSAGHQVTVVLAPLTDVPGDTNCDQAVDADDLIAVILYWGETSSLADVTHDGVVNADDLILVIESWTL